MQVALLLWYPEVPLLAGDELLRLRLVKTRRSNLFPIGSILCGRPLLSPEILGLHCYAFIIAFFSFMLLMFSLLAAPLDKCVYGISHVCKPFHKPLSKINKRQAERVGGGSK